MTEERRTTDDGSGAPLDTTAGDPGFGPLLCPKCGEETTISLDLDDVDNFECKECEQSFDRAEVFEYINVQVEKWRYLFAWLDKAPKLR